MSGTAYGATNGFSCGLPSTNKPIINVTEKVKHDADSGISGDTWALDAFTRVIKVYNVTGNTYCATVIWTRGTFEPVAGHASPGGTGTLTGDELGTFTGGYVTTQFTGNLNVSDPTHWPRTGKVINPFGGDVVDYQCTVDSNPTCAGLIDWSTKYFDTINNFGLSDWGWLYVTPNSNQDGTWTNANSGNSGDILDGGP